MLTFPAVVDVHRKVLEDQYRLLIYRLSLVLILHS